METNNKSKKVRVVVIDSGIDVNQYDLKQYVKESIGIKINSKGCFERQLSPRVEHPHGTVITAIIKQMCDSVEFYSVNILDRNLHSNGKVLIKSLKEAIKYKPHIVHLSLGTTSLRYWLSIRRCVRKLTNNNIIVIAASNNEGTRSYPAYLNKVVGVKGKHFNKCDSFYFKDGFFYAPLTLNYKLLQNNQEYRSVSGNSISAAYITGHFCRIILKCNFSTYHDVINYAIRLGEKNHKALANYKYLY